MSKTSKKAAAATRKARIEEMRRAEKARERRNRILTISLSTVIVVALAGWGAYAINSANEKDDQKAAAAKKPVSGEKTWNAKKLGRNHVKGTVKYPVNPPVGGNHNQAWMTCDGTVYTKPIANENAVHSMEHGAVWVTYNTKAGKTDVKALADKVSKTPVHPDEPGRGPARGDHAVRLGPPTQRREGVRSARRAVPHQVRTGCSDSGAGRRLHQRPHPDLTDTAAPRGSTPLRP